MIKKLFKILLILLLINTNAVNIFADQDYVGQLGSIEIIAKDPDNGTLLSGIEYKVYKLADLDDNNIEYNVLLKYQDIITKIDDSVITAESDWADLKDDFYLYIVTNAVNEDYLGTTNSDGKVTFTDLSVGLYLVVGEKTKIIVDDLIYHYEPTVAIVSVPDIVSKTVGYEYKYDVLINSKVTKTLADMVNVEAIKNWNDAGYENKRPESVTVELYKDSDLFDTQVLNEANSFTYKWNNLDNDFVWTIKEVEVAGYETSYDKQTSPDGTNLKLTVTIKNKYIVPHDPHVPTIPNTGVNWLPLPILLVSGIACLIIGRIIERRNEA